LVWDEVVLNRGVEQIVPDGALPTPDLPNKSSISFEKTCKHNVNRDALEIIFLCKPSDLQ